MVISHSMHARSSHHVKGFKPTTPSVWDRSRAARKASARQNPVHCGSAKYIAWLRGGAVSFWAFSALRNQNGEFEPVSLSSSRDFSTGCPV